MQTLRECPFCGNDAYRHDVEDHGNRFTNYYVLCSNADCPVSELAAHGYSQRKADIAWNTRADEPRYTITEAGRAMLRDAQQGVE